MATPQAGRILFVLIALEIGVIGAAIAVYVLAPPQWRESPLFLPGLTAGVAAFNLGWNKVFSFYFAGRRRNGAG